MCLVYFSYYTYKKDELHLILSCFIWLSYLVVFYEYLASYSENDLTLV